MTNERNKTYNFFEFPEKCIKGVHILTTKSMSMRTKSFTPTIALVKTLHLVDDWLRKRIELPNFMLRRCNKETESRFNIKCHLMRR